MGDASRWLLFFVTNQGERNEHLQNNQLVPGQGDRVSSCHRLSWKMKAVKVRCSLAACLIDLRHPVEFWPFTDLPSPRSSTGVSGQEQAPSSDAKPWQIIFQAVAAGGLLAPLWQLS